jgi:hypothetical protein
MLSVIGESTGLEALGHLFRDGPFDPLRHLLRKERMPFLLAQDDAVHDRVALLAAVAHGDDVDGKAGAAFLRTTAAALGKRVRGRQWRTFRDGAERLESLLNGLARLARPAGLPFGHLLVGFGPEVVE